MVGGNLTDVFEELALRSTYDIHHLLVVCPLLRGAQHLFKQAFAFSILHELEVVRTLVACERQENHPLAFILEEGSYRVFTHVRSHGERINVHFFKEATCIHR